MKRLSLFLLVTTLLVANSIPAFSAEKNIHGDKVVVYYFYDSFRCKGCIKVESTTKNATERYAKTAPIPVEFISLNIDEQKNAHYLTDFGVEAKIPFAVLYEEKKVVKKCVLEEAWPLKENIESYLSYITKEIDSLIIPKTETVSNKTTTYTSPLQDAPKKLRTNNDTQTWYYHDWIAKANYAPTFEVLDTESSLGAYADKAKTITLKDLVKMHGHLCDGLVMASCGLSLGFKELYPDGMIDRTDTCCITNNSPCYGDVAAYLTGGRIRFGTQKIDPNMGNEFIIYRISTNQAVKISLRDGVFPSKLAELERKIKSENFTIEQMQQCQILGWEFAESILNRPLEKSFAVKELDTFTWKPDSYIYRGSRSDIINKNFMQNK